MMRTLMGAADCWYARPNAAPLYCCRSLLEPIRTSNPFATYVEAACDSLDHDKKVRTATLRVPSPQQPCSMAPASSTLHHSCWTGSPCSRRKLAHLLAHGSELGLRICSVQVAYCTSAVAFEDGRRPQFEIPYDMVVVAVGEQPATFGVPGWYHLARINSAQPTDTC